MSSILLATGAAESAVATNAAKKTDAEDWGYDEYRGYLMDFRRVDWRLMNERAACLIWRSRPPSCSESWPIAIELTGKVGKRFSLRTPSGTPLRCCIQREAPTIRRAGVQ
ncbi:MAG: hypothetical protein WA706_17875, partial [Pseudolabrys sp.]|jgi:hypothetical protein